MSPSLSAPTFSLCHYLIVPTAVASKDIRSSMASMLRWCRRAHLTKKLPVI